MKKIWTLEQEEFLKLHYENFKTSDLLKVLTDKTNDQLRWKAKQHGLIKKISRTKTNANFLENLDDPISCYWWGFLTADGCITKKQLILSIHERDSSHLQKFCELANSSLKFNTKSNSWHKTPYTMGRTVVNDKFLLERLYKRFSIVPQKTYNPFDLTEFLTKNRILFFLVGLIDGDGHISKSKNGYSIRIKVHPNWKDAFLSMQKSLKKHFDLESTVKIQKSGWLIFGMYRKSSFEFLKSSTKNIVPLLERKWN